MSGIAKQVEKLQRIEIDRNESTHLDSGLFTKFNSRGYQLKSITENEPRLYGPNKKNENEKYKYLLIK